MARRTQRNAGGNSNTLLLLAAAGVGVYGYMQGWFSGLFGAAAPAATSAAPAPAAVPPLGTTVSSAAQVGAQAAAKDPFILPDGPTFQATVATPPSGYTPFSLTDKGNVFLRSDVYAAANAAVNANSAPLSLSALQSLMTTGGMSGLGQYAHYLGTRYGKWR
jgi:hypothetical protein